MHILLLNYTNFKNIREIWKFDVLIMSTREKIRLIARSSFDMIVYHTHTHVDGLDSVKQGKFVAGALPGGASASTSLWASMQEILTLLLANNKGADQPAQSDQRLCYSLYLQKLSN